MLGGPESVRVVFHSSSSRRVVSARVWTICLAFRRGPYPNGDVTSWDHTNGDVTTRRTTPVPHASAHHGASTWTIRMVM